MAVTTTDDCFGQSGGDCDREVQATRGRGRRDEPHVYEYRRVGVLREEDWRARHGWDCLGAIAGVCGAGWGQASDFWDQPNRMLDPEERRRADDFGHGDFAYAFFGLLEAKTSGKPLPPNVAQDK